MRSKKVFGKEPTCSEHGVKRSGAVTLAHDEAVALGPEWVLRIESKNVAQIQSCEDVRAREIATGMPNTGMMRHRHRAEADQVRLFTEPCGISRAGMAWSRSVVRTWQSGLLPSTDAIQTEL